MSSTPPHSSSYSSSKGSPVIRQRTRRGTSRTGVPVSTSSPNAATSTRTGIESQTVTPAVRGSATQAPITPPPACRPASSPGAPTERCQTPSTPRPSSRAPTTVRGRVSGSGSVRMSTTAIPSRITGSPRATDPSTVRNATWIPVPTGPPAPSHRPAAVISARTTSPRAIPSRRWAASISRPRPMVRATEPRPRAASVQVPFRPRTSGPGPRRGAGRRAGARRPPLTGARRPEPDRPDPERPDPDRGAGCADSVVRAGVRPRVRGRLRAEVSVRAMADTVAVTPHPSREPHARRPGCPPAQRAASIAPGAKRSSRSAPSICSRLRPVSSGMRT